MSFITNAGNKSVLFNKFTSQLLTQTACALLGWFFLHLDYYIFFHYHSWRLTFNFGVQSVIVFLELELVIITCATNFHLLSSSENMWIGNLD